MPPKKGDFLELAVPGEVVPLMVRVESIDVYTEVRGHTAIFVHGVEFDIDLTLEEFETLLEDKKK